MRLNLDPRHLGGGKVRFVVYGAGAIGGVVGARLHQAGEEVLLIARGSHLQQLQAGGLNLLDEDGVKSLPIRAVGHPSDVTWRPEDVLLLAVKSQDTSHALQELARTVSADLPVFCFQNGVSNERQALRLFAHVYGVCVNCPTDNPRPGAVSTSAVPTGMLDIGRYPQGRDELSDDFASTLLAATFEASSVEDVMSWKYSKLLLNLANAAKIACGEGPSTQDTVALAMAEGRICLDVAGVGYVAPEETVARRRARLRPHEVRGSENRADWRLRQQRTWAAEADHLNGEIVLLGREHGVPTPVNAALQVLARRIVNGAAPGSFSVENLF
jgi:2-dehydropantoate 2-reductase